MAVQCGEGGVSHGEEEEEDGRQTRSKEQRGGERKGSQSFPYRVCTVQTALPLSRYVITEQDTLMPTGGNRHSCLPEAGCSILSLDLSPALQNSLVSHFESGQIRQTTDSYS